MYQIIDGIASSKNRESYALAMSVSLHIIILVLMLFNFTFGSDDYEKSPPVILMVDLTNVKLGEKTNLPPLVKEQKKAKEEPAPAPQKPQKEDKTPSVRQEAPAPQQEVKPKEAPAPKEAVKVQEKKETPKQEKKPVKQEKPKPKPKPTPKPAPKPAPKTPPKKQAPKPAQNSLQSLLASVEKVRKPATPAPASKSTSTGANTAGATQNKGIEGGTGGSLMSDLTISEKDLIASKIRQCWNINAGVENVDQIIVELHVAVNKDGSVREARITNMKNDPVFRSMAESARRAIYVCDALKEESPFRILATKHPETYNSWRDMYLRMNPVDGGIF